MAITNGTVTVPPDSTGKIIDTNELTVNAKTVERQNISIADPETAGNVAYVNSYHHQDANADPGAAKFGVIVEDFPQVFNGTTFDRMYGASAANLAGQSGKGANISAPPGQWSVVHAPAVNTQATASKAAGAAGVRHVCTGFVAGLASDGTGMTVPASPVYVVVRDGATGAGTIIYETVIGVVTTAGAATSIVVGGLNLVGTAATAMTAEFTAAGGAHSFETISISGYDVS